jgi:hypothetical protein
MLAAAEHLYTGDARKDNAEKEAAGDRWQDWDLVWCEGDGQPTCARPVELDYSISPRRPARLEIIAG